MGQRQAVNTRGLSVTAIVPTFNRAHFLAKAIRSLLEQTLPPTQVIVVDDGSSDSTGDVIRAFGERVQGIRKDNGGKSSALNCALRLAEGEFIWIFDDDDIAMPDALEKLISALVSRPECGFSYGRYDHLIETEGKKPQIVRPKLGLDSSLDLRLAILERCFIFQPGLLVRRSCYDALGPFDESLVRSQDYDMLLRLSRAYAGTEVESVVFHQRQHAGVRGSAARPLAGKKVAHAWMHFDQVIFTRIYESYPLAEYLPGTPRTNRALSCAHELTALLERCCVMARKGMWEHAANDVKAIGELLDAHPELKPAARDLATLKRFFGPYSYADHAIAESGIFFAYIHAFVPKSFRRLMLRMLFLTLLSELGYALRNGHVRYFLGTARKCLRLSLMYLRTYQSGRRTVNTMSRI